MIRIGFDIDGVLYPWHWSIYRYYIEQYKFNGTFSQFWNDYWETPKIQKELTYLMSVPIFYNDMLANPEHVKLLNKLSEKNEIFYITSRSEDLRRITKKFLIDNKFPFSDEVLFMGNDHKSLIVKHIGIELFVDDRTHNVAELSKVTLALLLAKIWNRDGQNVYPTIRSLSEITRYLED